MTIPLTSPGPPLNIEAEIPMRRFVPRYTHVRLMAVSALLLLAIIAWLLASGGNGLLDPLLRLTAPVAPIVALPPTAPATAPASLAAMPGPKPAAPVEAPVRRSLREPSSRTSAAGDRYVLESGPLTTPEVADRLEDELNRRGHVTVRFRKQDVTRFYLVAATGFASTEEAKRAVTQIGRGVVVEAAGAAEVLVDRLPSLGEAIAAARPLRARDFEVRVSEAVSPTVVYHIRYGQFGTRAQAQAFSEDLARTGIKSRVVKIR